MNIADEYRPEASPHLKRLGEEWLTFCRNQPFNLQAPMPAVWHLAVTLQSNNPNVTFEQMDTALSEWDFLINRDALGKRSNQHLSKQWRYIATYEGQTGDTHDTPHWHLIMTTGFGLRPEKAKELLAERRVSVFTKRKRMEIVGARRVPVVQETFSRNWAKVMRKGEVVAHYLHHPSEEMAWSGYIVKGFEGRRFVRPNQMALSQGQIQIGGHGFQG